MGDELVIEIGERESSWRIVGIVLLTGNGGVDIAYANRPALADASGMVGRATNAAVKIRDADDPLAQRTVARALERQYERAGMGVGYSQILSELVANSVNQLDMVVYFLLMMAGLLAVVGGLGLAATMGLNMLERTREIGVLRAIGATDWSMWSIVVAESALVGLISWMLGTLLSYPLGSLLSSGVGMAFMGIWIEHVFCIAGVWLWLGVAIVVSVVAGLAPARRASRISVREALAYE